MRHFSTFSKKKSIILLIIINKTITKLRKSCIVIEETNPLIRITCHPPHTVDMSLSYPPSIVDICLNCGRFRLFFLTESECTSKQKKVVCIDFGAIYFTNGNNKSICFI